MRILVLGATGMLGHAACRVLGREHEVFGTCRDAPGQHPGLAAFLPVEQCYDGVAAGDLARLDQVLTACRPAVVLNCIGIVKQRKEAHSAVPSIRVNSLFPHELAEACDRTGAKMIQVSTDCVFSGRAGNSDETATPDPVDLYGRTKLLGEVIREPHLTIRTSMIGRELGALAGRPTTGLLEWFLSQRGGGVRGYSHAIFSGLTTRALARVLLETLRQAPALTGLCHVAAAPLSKYELLMRLNDLLGLGVRVERDDSFHCDRSLDGRRFAEATGVRVPSWEEMLAGLREECEDYEKRG